MPLNLFKHQQRFLSRGANKCVLAWETGTGKTLTALEWAKNKGGRVLIICPKTLKPNWLRSIFNHGCQFPCDVVTKEEFKKKAKDLVRNYDAVVIDEAHFFGNYKSQMTKALLLFIKYSQIRNVLCLTATPYMSTPWNIYTLGLIVGRNWSWVHFNNTFFVKVPMGSRLIPVVREEQRPLLLQYIHEISDVVKLADCVDVPPDNMVVEYFSMNNEQKKFIKGIFEPHHLTRWTKIHQVCGGTVKNTEYDDESHTRIPSDKLERCIELGMEIDKPIIVCRYNGEVQLIAERLKALGKTVYVINGETTNKQNILDEAHLEPNCAVVVNAACSEGWQLPSCNTMIFYSYDFSLKNYIQMRGRIQRIDNIQTCTYISLVTEKSVDEAVYKAVVEDKMDFQTNIYSGTI